MRRIITRHDPVTRRVYDHALGKIQELDDELRKQKANVYHWMNKAVESDSEVRDVAQDLCMERNKNARLKRALDEFHDASFSMADKEMADEITILKRKNQKLAQDSYINAREVTGIKFDIYHLTAIKDRWRKLALKRTKKIGRLEMGKEYWFNLCHKKNREIADANERIDTLKKELVTLWDQIAAIRESISSELDNLSSVATRGRSITGKGE